jgi:hypothetical protein
MSASDEKTIWATPAVFVRGCLVLTLVAILSAAVMGVVAASAIYRERDLALRMASSGALLASCTLDRAKLEGRVHSFESVFITTKRTAIDASIREFSQHVGGETDKRTLDEFADWLRRTHP